MRTPSGAAVVALSIVAVQAIAGTLLFEGFNQDSLPAGWTVSNQEPLTFVTSSGNPTAAPYEGTHFVKFASYTYSSGTRSLLTSPAISTLGKYNITVTFAWHRDSGWASSQDRVIVRWSTNGTTWSGTNTYLRYSTTTGWTMQTCPLPAAAANQPTLYVRFEFVSAYGNNCYLDAVRITGTYPGEPSPPAQLVATATSSSDITLTWQRNATGDVVMIATNTLALFGIPSNGVAYAEGDTLAGGGGVLYLGTGTVLHLSGLQSGTRYYFRAWSVSTLTNYSDSLDAEATTDFILPINEGFNSPLLPAGWSISNSTYLTIVSSSTSPSATPYEGTHFVRFNSFNASSGTYASLISPRFSSLGSFAAIVVDFAWHQDPGWPSDNDSVTLQWSTNGTHWASVQTFYRLAPQTGWTLQRAFLPLAALGHPRMQVRFHFLSQYGNNCYLDDVHIFAVEHNLYLKPAQQAGDGTPGATVPYTLELRNLTGADRGVLLTYHSPWPSSGPAMTGIIPHGGTTNISLSVQVPTSAIDSQTSTTLVQAVTADYLYTNTAIVITRCIWTYRPICEWFQTSLGAWTNYFTGPTNSGWYWDWWWQAAAHEQETGGTNWLVSPAIDLNHGWADSLRLSFWFGVEDDLLYPEGVYLVTGNRNPNFGKLTRLADIQYVAGNWLLNELDITTYRTNVPVYLAFDYISTNPYQLITGVCIEALKTGIDNAVLRGPATFAMTSYATTPIITGAVAIAAETGTGGPATLVEAQLGFGPHALLPNDTDWTWFPATYAGADGAYDVFTAAPQLTLAGTLRYCYRFRRGNATWVYADLNGSHDGFHTNLTGVAHVAMLPPQGALLRHQTISLDWQFGPSSYVNPSNTPPLYRESADDLSLPYDAILNSIRVGGLYWGVGRQNLEQGFWVRVYAHGVTNPAALLHEQHVPGYACEEWLGMDSYGYHDYKYHVALSPPLYVPAGTTVWISVQHEVRAGTFWSLLDTPDPVRGYDACQRSSATGTWWLIGDGGYDLGMEVYGDVTNAGFINGHVFDAESMAPIQGALVLITNNVYVNSVLSDSNGFYSAPAPAGTYEIVVSKANYLPATAHGVVVTVGSTNTVDFYLEGSYLHVSPTNISRVMTLNSQTLNPLVLSNTGPLPVQFTLTIRNLGASTTLAARITHVSIPPCNGSFPRSSTRPSLARAPRRSTSLAPTPTAPRALSLPPVTAYGFNIYPASPNALIRLTTDNPGALTTVGTANTGPNGFVCGATFLHGDFSKLYCLVYEDNKLVTVNTLDASVTVIANCAPPAGEDWTGLAAAPDGTIYAVSYTGAASKLYAINPTNGAYSLVGFISNADLIVGIAINAAGEMYGLDIGNDILVRINRTTGAGTQIGSIGFNANYAQDLAFDLQHNVLYLAAYNASTDRGELRVADTTTGNSVLIGQFGSSQTEVDGFATMTLPPAPWARAETNAGALAAGEARTVQITFDASVVSNAGEYLAELLLRGTFVNAVPPVPLKMTILAEPVISAPSLLNFGDVLIGESTNLLLTISNVGFGMLTGQISAVNAPFGISGSAAYAIPAGHTSSHTLTFTPPAESSYTNVAVLTGGGGATVTLIGTGIPEPAVPVAACMLASALLRRAWRVVRRG
ncbi:MAG: choice-of-anchor J domain-containing protein [bacterium]|nr:choice-of-anchor J domain-containing protein [bacterium]